MHRLCAIAPITGWIVRWDFGAGPIAQCPELHVLEGSELATHGRYTGPVVAGIRGEDGLIVEVELVERPIGSWGSGELVADPARER